MRFTVSIFIILSLLLPKSILGTLGGFPVLSSQTLSMAYSLLVKTLVATVPSETRSVERRANCNCRPVSYVGVLAI